MQVPMLYFRAIFERDSGDTVPIPNFRGRDSWVKKQFENE